jgi:hypothetical protein
VRPIEHPRTSQGPTLVTVQVGVKNEHPSGPPPAPPAAMGPWWMVSTRKSAATRVCPSLSTMSTAPSRRVAITLPPTIPPSPRPPAPWPDTPLIPDWPPTPPVPAAASAVIPPGPPPVPLVPASGVCPLLPQRGAKVTRRTAKRLFGRTAAL